MFFSLFFDCRDKAQSAGVFIVLFVDVVVKRRRRKRERVGE